MWILGQSPVRIFVSAPSAKTEKSKCVKDSGSRSPCKRQPFWPADRNSWPCLARCANQQIERRIRLPRPVPRILPPWPRRAGAPSCQSSARAPKCGILPDARRRVRPHKFRCRPAGIQARRQRAPQARRQKGRQGPMPGSSFRRLQPATSSPWRLSLLKKSFSQPLPVCQYCIFCENATSL